MCEIIGYIFADVSPFMGILRIMAKMAKISRYKNCKKIFILSMLLLKLLLIKKVIATYSAILLWSHLLNDNSN